METTLECPEVWGGGGDLSELLRSHHSHPTILGTNPDQFYLNTITSLIKDYRNDEDITMENEH